MSTSPTASAGEFEFNESQNKLIGSLARKMALVGLVMMFFGVLQMINGVTSLIMSRNPDRVISAAQKAGMPEDQLVKLKASSLKAKTLKDKKKRERQSMPILR